MEQAREGREPVHVVEGEEGHSHQARQDRHDQHVQVRLLHEFALLNAGEPQHPVGQVVGADLVAEDHDRDQA